MRPRHYDRFVLIGLCWLYGRSEFPPPPPPPLHLFAVVCAAGQDQHGALLRAALPVTKLRSIFHFRVGAHSLPVEQGRIQMPKVPRHLRRCTFCATNAIGDERHCVFDCPHFQGLRQQHAMIFKESHDAMRSVMWHKDQKSVCALVLAIVNEAQTL